MDERQQEEAVESIGREYEHQCMDAYTHAEPLAVGKQGLQRALKHYEEDRENYERQTAADRDAPEFDFRTYVAWWIRSGLSPGNG